MSYIEAKAKYAALGVDTDAAIAKLKAVPVALHCWQGDDVRGFDTDPNKPLTGGIQTTGNYPGRARTPDELMADMVKTYIEHLASIYGEDDMARYVAVLEANKAKYENK